MTQYRNRLSQMGYLVFSDGSSQFVTGKSTFETNKKVKRMSKGIDIKESSKSKKTKSKETETENNNNIEGEQ